MNLRLKKFIKLNNCSQKDSIIVNFIYDFTINPLLKIKIITFINDDFEALSSIFGISYKRKTIINNIQSSGNLVAVSPQLLDKYKDIDCKKFLLIPWVTKKELEHINQSKVNKINKNKNKIIFLGFVNKRIDFELLKNIDQSGQMTVYVNESNKQILNVDLQNDEKRSRSFHDFKLLDLNERKITPLPPEFDIIVEMKTEDFHNMCKELAAVGQFMIVECTEKKIEFKCRGNIRNTRKEFEHDDNRENGTVSITVNKNRANKNEPVIVREIYDLNDIIMFNKCKSLCTDIQILLRNEYIMFIRYEVASYGMMTVGFNPANEKLVNKHGNYDGKFNAFYGKNTAFEMKYKS
jgi:hypothetical protein